MRNSSQVLLGTSVQAPYLDNFPAKLLFCFAAQSKLLHVRSKLYSELITQLATLYQEQWGISECESSLE